MLLKVMAGDQLSIKVTSWYTAGGASPVGKISSTEINATVLQNPLKAFSDIVCNNTNTLTTKPKAHLNPLAVPDVPLGHLGQWSKTYQYW